MTGPSVSTEDAPPLYDVDKALRELARNRRRNDPLTRQTVLIADKLAVHMARHFTAEEAGIAGRAMIIAAASATVITMATPDLTGQAAMNVIAYAGHQLVLFAAEADS